MTKAQEIVLKIGEYIMNATKYKIWSAPNIQKGYPAYF